MKPERKTCCADSIIYSDYGEQSPVDSGIINQLGLCSKVTFDDDFGESADPLLSLINLMPKQTIYNGYEINWNLIKLLAKFLGIEDYETNLFSGWVLRTILGHINLVSDLMNESDYRTFICWLYEEINFLSQNSNMTREVFFEIMSKIFHETLREILSGKGLPLPQKFFSEFFSGEEDLSKFRSNSFESAEMENIDDTNLGEEESNGSSKIELLINYYKRILYTIIEATYEIFGTEFNYELIQFSSAEQRNNILYPIPYHYRKPKIMRKVESSIDLFEESKKRKSILKDVETIDSKSCSSSIVEKRLFCFEKHRYFSPLSEALEATDVLLQSLASDVELLNK